MFRMIIAEETETSAPLSQSVLNSIKGPDRMVFKCRACFHNEFVDYHRPGGYHFTGNDAYPVRYFHTCKYPGYVAKCQML
jgi:hypothetical protein